MSLVSQILRDSATGQDCTFQIPGVCNHNPETSVLCHAPTEWKGTGNKSPDFCAAIGCSDCHYALDQNLARDDFEFYWRRGQNRTMKLWVELGLISVSGIDLNKPKTPKVSKTKMPKSKQKIQSRKSIPSRKFQNRKKEPKPWLTTQ